MRTFSKLLLISLCYFTVGCSSQVDERRSATSQNDTFGDVNENQPQVRETTDSLDESESPPLIISETPMTPSDPSLWPDEGSLASDDPPTEVEPPVQPFTFPLVAPRTQLNDTTDEPEPLKFESLRPAALPNMLSDEPNSPTLPLDEALDDAKLAGTELRESNGASATNDESERGENSVVKVFYGTDRQAIGASMLARIRVNRYVSVLVTFAATLLFGGLAYVSSRRKLAVMVGLAGVLASGVLGARVVVNDFDTSRELTLSYGAKRGSLQMGVCEVSIPKDHRIGEIESPTILRLEFRPDKSKHVVLQKLEVLPPGEFFQDLRTCVASSKRKEAFVFVHGYNVTFEKAALRTAQMAHDLKFDGAPIFYSWPSQGSILKYTVDENNVTWTVPHLKQFLVDIAEQSGANEIHLVAHSMGNRALTTALRELTYDQRDNTQLFNQVVLAAPDIDADIFKRQIAPAIQKTARRVTLYASSNDQALLASKQVHGYARAGDSGAGLVVIPGIETVDVSAVETSFLGHSYYGDNNSIISDLFHLLHKKLPASHRDWLRPKDRDGLTYWEFHGQENQSASTAEPGLMR